MEDKYTKIVQKIASDTAFNIAVFSFLLMVRKQALRNAILKQKLTPISTAILSFQKTRNIKSTLFYSKRLIAYLTLGGISSGICQSYDQNGIGTLLKGMLCGVSFGFIKTGMVGGILGALTYEHCEQVLKEYL